MSASSVPQISYKSTPKVKHSKKEFKACVEIPKKDSVFEQKIELPKISEKVSFFDSLGFSDDDDEEEDVESERKSLLEQLKNTQPWKKSPTPPELPQTSSSLDTVCMSSPKTLITSSEASHFETFTKPGISASKFSITNTTANTTTTITTTTTTTTILPSTSAIVSDSLLQHSGTTVSSLNSTATSASLEFSSVTANSKLETSTATSMIPQTPSTSSTVTSSISTSLISTSEVDISFVSKQHLAQAVTSPAMLSSQQSSGSSLVLPITTVTSSPTSLHYQSSLKMEGHQNLSGKPTSRRTSQAPSNLHATLPSFASTKPNITISHGALPHQRQAPVPSTTLYTSSGEISATLPANHAPTFIQTSSLPITQSMSEPNSSASQTPTQTVNQTEQQNVMNSEQILQTQMTCQPSSVVQQPTLTTAISSHLVNELTPQNNSQVTQHHTPFPNQSIPVQLVRQNSVSVVGNQGMI